MTTTSIRVAALAAMLLALPSCGSPRSPGCRCEGAVPSGTLSVECGAMQCVGGTLYSCTGQNAANVVGTSCTLPPGDAGPCTVGPSQILSMPCCPNFGADACGAGLFCAAFDGRMIPTCYANNTRLDNQTCTADIQCASMECNTSASACRAIGPPCDPAIGCSSITGPRRGCVRTSSGGHTCTNVGTGALGQVCRDDTDCTAGSCDMATGRCMQTSNAGQPCTFDPSAGNYTRAGCHSATGPGYCFATYVDSGTVMAHGYCVDPCETSTCPAGTICDNADSTIGTGPPGRGCIPTCVTADSCPIPEAACRDRGMGPECRFCSSSSECSAGRTCHMDSSGINGACL
jgi:hypothetical protein